ncbi:RagB/SusD family nutrient uptake outer membrane protein [Bacteroides sp. 51]|uniref:RagB/SusD family nutrient uptake outer membrane protein n=1 Tax=Bacteroides sp. 51 TaxID=2302938 RepID=UPI0013D556CD|nr:RagB/SusD family nutrient uptake outer membrane protein [Bacteroides sp. 51]NDV82616.1 RagB/SusD family nutrient uptake outer membrane protein [Bacteroides sp. 51]
MKNNIYKTILYTALVATTSACVGLDSAPYDKETDLTYWEKPEAAIYSLNGCYPTLFSAEEVLYADAMSDNAYTKATVGFNQAIGSGTHSTDYPYLKSVWDSRYGGVKKCNELLNNIDRVPGLSAETKEQYIAEATVIRAFHYFELYSRFGDVPYFTNVISIKESQQLVRTPKQEIVTKILEELTTIIDNNALPASYGDADKGRITRWAAMALKARILLFEGNWKEVKAVTDRIMKQGPHRLFPSYSGLFEVANENNEEVILDLQYISPEREHNKQYEFLPPTLGGYAQLAPLQELVDSYLDGDPRLDATIVYSGNSYQMADGTYTTINTSPGVAPDGYGYSSNCSPTGYYIKKYWDKTFRGGNMSGLNIILIRYADVLLMHAEALAELGEMNETAWNETIRLIRQRAGFTDNAVLQFPGTTDIVNVIRRERRSELALEGLRYKDIIRWKIGKEVMNGWCHGLYTGEIIGTDNGFMRVEQRTFNTDKHYLWPIPQSERDLNKNLTQNPNW